MSGAPDQSVLGAAVSASATVGLIFGVAAVVDRRDLRAWWKQFRKNCAR